MRTITTPISDDVIRELKVGEPVALSGIMVTGRDAAHKWMIETFVKKTREPQGDDLKVYEDLKRLLNGSVIYHCGPVVSGLDTKEYKFVAAGPTTSIREEPYQAEVIDTYKVRGVIGKGGMGPKTSEGLKKTGAVYLHATGGAGSLLAERVKRVVDVKMLEEFGSPEAFWIIEVEDFPLVVTMDSHGGSLHEEVATASQDRAKELMAQKV